MAKNKDKLLINVNDEVKDMLLDAKNQVVDLEKFYVNGKVDGLLQYIEEKKKDLVNTMVEYGRIAEGKEYNPYLVSTFFFKSINPLPSIIPDYSAEKLSIVWDYYMYLIEQININVGIFQPTLTHFCKFAGISLSVLKSYRENPIDNEMHNIIEKIFDETFDSNIMLAQNKKLVPKITEFRMKAENDVQDKPQVKVNVNLNQNVDLKSIANRLDEIKKLNKKVEKSNNLKVEERFVYEEEN